MCNICGDKYLGNCPHGLSEKDVDEIMKNANPEFARRWCESKVCCCTGCVNNFAYLNGISKEQWNAWLNRQKAQP